MQRTITNEQNDIINNFINLHKPAVREHVELCERDLKDWFRRCLDEGNYTVEDGVARVEIRGLESKTGNPIIFEFEAAAFDL